MLVELTDDWRYVFSKYRQPFKSIPEVGDLIYVTYVGIFKAEKVYSNKAVGVTFENRCFIFPYSYYRVVELPVEGRRYRH